MTTKSNAKKLSAEMQDMDINDLKAKANKLGKKLVKFAEEKGEDLLEASEKAAGAAWTEIKAQPVRSALLALAIGYIVSVLPSFRNNK